MKVVPEMWDFLEPVAGQRLMAHGSEQPVPLTAGAVFLQYGALRQLLTTPHWQVVLAGWFLHPAWDQPFTTPGEE